MSADNAVVVLMTAGPNGSAEYRVSSGQAIENIFDLMPCRCEPTVWYNSCPECVQWKDWYALQVENEDYETLFRNPLNPTETRQFFSESNVFTEREDALSYAERLDGRKTEYGVFVYEYPYLTFPANDLTSTAT